MLRNLAYAIPILMAGGAQWFDVMLDGAIALYTADGSSGATMTEQVAARTATITGGHNYTAYSNHSGARKAFRGNGERYASVPTAVGLDVGTFSAIIAIKLGVYDTTAETIVHFYTDANNQFKIQHTAANQLTTTHIQTGTTVTTVTTGVPENELIVIAPVVASTAYNLYIPHADGIVTDTDTYAGSISGAFTSLTIGAMNDGSLPLKQGMAINAVGFYNVAKTQAQVQAVYDALAVTLADAPLYNLSPTGDSLSQASYSGRTTSIAVSDLGVSDYTVEVTSNADPVTDVTSLFLRHSVNVSEMVELRFTVAGACEVYEYDPTATLIGTITAVDGALLKFVFAGTALTAYKNGATTASLAVTLATEAEYGTKYYATVAGTHNFDMTVYDTYTQRFANDIQVLNYLNADMYFKNGSLTERLGTGRDLSPNEVRLVEGDRFLFSESDSSLLQTYAAELNTDSGSWMFEGNAYSLGGNSTGKFFKQLSSNDVLELASTTGLNYEVNYVTTDLQAKLTSGGIVLGDNTLVIASMDEATDTAELYTNATANTLSTDTAGVGGRTTGTGNYIYGNDLATSGNDAWYGTFQRMAKLHQLATESLNDMIQAEMVIKNYHANLKSILSPTLALVPQPDATFEDDMTGTTVTGTNLTVSTVRDSIGQYALNFDGSTGYLNLNTTTFTSSFNADEFVLYFRLAFDNVTNTTGNIEYLARLYLNGSNEITFYRNNSSARIEFYRLDPSDSMLVNYTVTDTDLHDYVVRCSVSAGLYELWVDGVLTDTDTTPSAFSTGTYSIVGIGTGSQGSFFRGLDGKLSQFSYSTSALSVTDIMRASNLITANGATWYKHLSDTYTLTKLNNSYGNNLMSSGGSADTLSSATVSALYAPNAQQYIDFTSAGHLNIGLTSLSMNNKRYSFYVQPATNTVSTTLCQAFLIYVDADNYISGYFGTTASQLIVDYRAAGATNQMTFDTAAATVNYLVEIDIPASGGTAELFINGTSTDTVVLTNDMVGTTLSDGNTVVGALNTSNTSHLQGYATNLQITSIPADGLSDYTDAVGTVLS